MDRTTSDNPKPVKSKWDRRIKIGFVVVTLAAVAVVYMLQRRDRGLSGWGVDLGAALQKAKDNPGWRVLVFFTHSRMSEDDKHAVNSVIERPVTRKTVKELNYIPVHLNLDDHAGVAAKYGVSDTPCYLLLDANGALIRSKWGKMNDNTFCTEFLKDPQKPTAPARP
jgi:hypothetical protein